MPDNKNIRHPHDGKRIDVNDPSEVAYWCKSLGVSKEELKATVEAVGDSAKAVKEYLAHEKFVTQANKYM